MFLWIFFLSSILCASCLNDIKSNLNEMKSHEVLYCLNEMDVVLWNKDSIDIDKFISEDKKYNLIVYYDSLNCMSCMSGKLHQWDYLIKDINLQKMEVKILFIFEPKITEYESIINTLISERFSYPVFVDNLHSFSNKNKFIPSQSLYHIFLVDRHSNIVLVGDPRKSDKIYELFYNIVRNDSVI